MLAYASSLHTFIHTFRHTFSRCSIQCLRTDTILEFLVSHRLPFVYRACLPHEVLGYLVTNLHLFPVVVDGYWIRFVGAEGHVALNLTHLLPPLQGVLVGVLRSE